MSWSEFFFGAFVGAFLTLMAGIAFCSPDAWWQGEAAKHACAHYDTQTGAWQWNTPAQGGTP
jgi:hypothetical protein